MPDSCCAVSCTNRREGRNKQLQCYIIPSKRTAIGRRRRKERMQALDERTEERGQRKRYQDNKYAENISYQVIISQFIVSVCFLKHLHVNLLYTLEYRVPNNRPSRLLIFSNCFQPPLHCYSNLPYTAIRESEFSSLGISSLQCATNYKPRAELEGTV